MNPIDDERLNLDAVHNAKRVVKSFYIKKNAQCNSFLADLDRMNAERPNILELKKYFINNSKPIVPMQKDAFRSANLDTVEILKEVNMNTTLARI